MKTDVFIRGLLFVVLLPASWVSAADKLTPEEAADMISRAIIYRRREFTESAA